MIKNVIENAMMEGEMTKCLLRRGTVVLSLETAGFKVSCFLGFLAASPVKASIQSLPASNMDGYKS
jgi:hypothetical protein